MSHEQPTPNNPEEQSSSRVSKLKRWGMAGAAAIGLATAIGANMAGDEIQGRAVVSAEHHEKETDTVKYYRSEERNERIADDARNFSKRILDHANDHPELTEFHDLDASGKEDGKGLLSTRFNQGGKTYELNISAKKDGRGFDIDTLDTEIRATVSAPKPGFPDITDYEAATFNKIGDERNDGIVTWDVSTGKGFAEGDGRGGGGSLDSSLRVTKDPNITPDIMYNTENQVALDMDRILKQAGI